MSTAYIPKMGHYVAHQASDQKMIVVSQNPIDQTWYCVWSENGVRKEGYFKAEDLILIYPPTPV